MSLEHDRHTFQHMLGYTVTLLQTEVLFIEQPFENARPDCFINAYKHKTLYQHSRSVGEAPMFYQYKNVWTTSHSYELGLNQ